MSLGIDIGSKTIKVVELEDKGQGKFKLKTAGVVGYSGINVGRLQGEKDLALLADAIKKLLHDTKVSTKKVNVALPESNVFTRVIKFPLLTEQEIASAIKWEAEQYIPIPIKEAIIQYQIIERRESATPPEVLVLLVAAPRVFVEKYVKIVNSVGLSAVTVETELMSLVRSLAVPDRSSLLVDFGAHSTDIAIAKNSQLVFSRSIPTAGDALTRVVAQFLNVDAKQAEEYKRTYGLTSNQLEGKIANALAPVLRIVTEEIKKAIHFYQSDAQGESPSLIILSGGTAGMPDITTMLAKQLNIEVIIGDPFARLEVDSNFAKTLSSYAPLYPIAVGLAMGKE